MATNAPPTHGPGHNEARRVFQEASCTLDPSRYRDAALAESNRLLNQEVGRLDDRQNGTAITGFTVELRRGADRDVWEAVVTFTHANTGARQALVLYDRFNMTHAVRNEAGASRQVALAFNGGTGCFEEVVKPGAVSRPAVVVIAETVVAALKAG